MKGFHLGATLVLALVFASLIWYAVCFNSYVERMTVVPLGLSKNYCEVKVYNAGLVPGTNEQKAEFMARLLALIENKEVTIVASMQSLAIGTARERIVPALWYPDTPSTPEKSSKITSLLMLIPTLIRK